MTSDYLKQNYPNSVVSERPLELGEAYFYHKGNLLDVDPYLNHRDWALAQFPIDDPTNALFECYEQGMIRITWNQNINECVLYINGRAPHIWREMKNIMEEPRWHGNVDHCVIEYVANINNQPSWYKTEIYGPESLRSLSKGKRPSKFMQSEVNPDFAKLVGANRLMNDLNDYQPDQLLEMFNQHFLSSNFFDIGQRLPQNNYILQKSNDLVYL